MKILSDAPTLSPSQKLLLDCEDHSNRALNMLKAACVSSFNQFWRGPIPPEVHLQTLGTNARQMFLNHAATVTYLLAMGEQIDPLDYTPPADKPYTVHDNGTITFDVAEPAPEN